jgi:hypothetical protein
MWGCSPSSDSSSPTRNGVSAKGGQPRAPSSQRNAPFARSVHLPLEIALYHPVMEPGVKPSPTGFRDGCGSRRVGLSWQTRRSEFQLPGVIRRLPAEVVLPPQSISRSSSIPSARSARWASLFGRPAATAPAFFSCPQPVPLTPSSLPQDLQALCAWSHGLPSPALSGQ